MATKAAYRPALSTVYSDAQRRFYEKKGPSRDALDRAAAFSNSDERSSSAPADRRAASRESPSTSVEKSSKETAKPARKEGIARLMELAGRRRGLVAGAAVLAVLGSAARLAPFVAVYLMMNELILHWEDLGGIDWSLMGMLTAAAFLAAIAYGVFQYLSTMLAHTAAFNILYEVRVHLMDKLARVPSGFYSDVRQGEVKKVMNNDVEEIEGFVAHHLPDAVSAISLPLITLIYLFTVDWRFALALVVPIVLAFLLLGGALKTPEGKACQTAMRVSGETVAGTTVEYVHGMPVVKVFNRSLSAFRRFEADAREFVGNIKWATYFNAPGMGRLYAVIGAQVLFLLATTLAVLPTVNEADPVAYAKFLSTVLLFFLVGAGMKEPVMQMVSQSIQLNTVNVAVARVDEILDYPEVVEPLHPATPRDAGIEFEQVRFSYAGEDGPRALDSVSFRLPSGTVTGLVGPSGGGKSTIAALILRFFDVQEGSIRIGGANVKDIAYEDLTDLVSFVFQDSFLLADTLDANIRMGNEEASREQVMDAVRAASVEDVVERLPQGLDTIIGPGGTYLSGGEAQRVAIARVLLKDTPIVVLDEATAYADAENEGKIQRAFARLAQEKTVLIIAHRLKTVEAADRILVMEEGKLVGQGVHAELLASSETYRAMVAANEVRDTWDLSTGKEACHE